MVLDETTNLLNFITETELMSIVNDLSVDPAIVIIASLLKFLVVCGRVIEILDSSEERPSEGHDTKIFA